MLKVDRVTMRFGKQEVLHEVSCEIEPGSVTGILGQNGAGKTTLLRIIGGLLPATDGRVLYNGEKLRQERTGILLGGDVGLYRRLTARENIRYFADLHQLDRKQTEKRIEDLAELFSMTEYLDRYAEELSRGTRQKVSVIRTVIHDPDVILFDEPETGLDFEAARTISTYLSRLAAEGKTVIYSSHSIGNILSTCKNAYILHQGVVIDYCSISDLQHECTSAEAQEKVYQLVTNANAGRREGAES